MAESARLCVLCRGGRNLCGKAYCPVLTRIRIWGKVREVRSSSNLYGSSPPAVFVGRLGYPKVYVGPMAPPVRGDTSAYDTPEVWSTLSIEDVLEFRTSLVLGRVKLSVTDVDSRIAQALHELILTVRPTDVEMVFEKPPKGISFYEHEPPIGPRANLISFRITGSTSSHKVVERLYGDTDVRASTAVIELYDHGMPVSYIQKLISLGALGRRGCRRFVPTRWAITAVDDAISRYLVEKRVKRLNELDRVQIFVRSAHRNLFIAILIPGKWCFEWMEAWFPGSTWNTNGSSVVVEGDHELYTANRKTYASIGGCYYAARLATAEYLTKIGRQAVAVVLREIYPGFDIPIGVWFVREQLRTMYSGKPFAVVETVDEALRIVERYSSLGLKVWIEKSYVLKKILRETKIDRFLY